MAELSAIVAENTSRLDALRVKLCKQRYGHQRIEPVLPPHVQVVCPHASAAEVPDLTGSGHATCKLLRALAYLADVAHCLHADTAETLLPALSVAATSAPHPPRSSAASSTAASNDAMRVYTSWLTSHAAVFTRFVQRQAELEKVLKNLLAQAVALCSSQPDQMGLALSTCLQALLDTASLCMVTLLQMQCVVAHNGILKDAVRFLEAAVMHRVSGDAAAVAAYDAYAISVSLPGKASHAWVEVLAVLQRLLALLDPPCSLLRFLEWDICSSVLGSELASRALLKVSAQHACARGADALRAAASADRTTANDRAVCSAWCLSLLHICVARNAANHRVLRYLTTELPRSVARIHIWGPIGMRPLSGLFAALPSDLHHILPRALQPLPYPWSALAAAGGPAPNPPPAGEGVQSERALQQRADLLHLTAASWLLSHKHGCLAELFALSGGLQRPPSGSNVQEGDAGSAAKSPPQPSSSAMFSELSQSGDASSGWFEWRPPSPRRPSPAAAAAAAPAVTELCRGDQQALLALMRGVLGANTLLMRAVSLARQLTTEFYTAPSTSGSLPQSLLLAVSAAQSLRDWMARHAAGIAQVLPFVLAAALQALRAEVKQQQDALSRARRLLQLKRSTGLAALWRAFTVDKDQEMLNDREAMICSLEAGLSRVPTRYELLRMQMLVAALQPVGVSIGACARMTALLEDMRSFVAIAAGACFRCGEQIALLLQPTVLEMVLKHMLAKPASVMLLPAVARTLDWDAALFNCVHNPAVHLGARSTSILAAIESKLLLPIVVHLKAELHAQVVGISRPAADPGGKSYNISSADVAAILQMPHFALLGRVVSIRRHVEAQLYAHIFRQTTARAPDAGVPSWFTLSQEVHLAYLKYGLRLQGFVPAAQQVAVTHDLRGLLSDVASFCEANCYSLASHQFVESPSVNLDAAQLHSLSILHCTASFQTHGLGLLDATTQAVYNFLVETLYELSEWLFDRDVQARLQTDLTAISEHRAGQQLGEYGLAQAQATIAFAERKAEEDGQPRHYVDAVRQLITLIGNAVALLRLAHHGALHLATSTLPFLQPFTGVDEPAVSALKLAQQVAAGPELRGSAARLDRLLQDVMVMIERWPLHLRTLVASFSVDLRSQSNVHFQRLYLLLPAVSHNYVEVMLLCKERLSRRQSDPDAALAAFTDDGFPLGMAYMLAVLSQEQQFDALHWFTAAQQHYSAEVQRITDAAASTAPTPALSLLPSFMGGQVAGQLATEEQNTFLQLQNVQSYRDEYDLLERTLESCRTLFANPTPPALPATPLKAGRKL